MGCDIHSFVEVKKDGKWIKDDAEQFPCYKSLDSEPFGTRCYSMFGFLADVRNYSNCPVIHKPKGLPIDSDYLNEYVNPDDDKYCRPLRDELYDCGYHSHSYLSVAELLAFDYDQKFEDLRCEETIGNVTNCAAIAKPGNGEITTVREFLKSSYFFEHLEILKTLGHPDNVRVVFYFN